MDNHLDEDAIFGLAEGGLDASARAAAETHLRGCAACRREVEIASGYFKEFAELAALEPVKAPANFLANVRARLPRPSPLRAFLDRFMRPLRVIPMQVALLTILGLTAISSYLYQRGGLNKEESVVISQSAAEATSERPEPLAESPTTASKSIDPLKKSSQAPRPIRKRARSEQVPSELSLRESDQLFAEDRDAPASAPATPHSTPLAPVSPSRQAAPPAPTAAAVPAPAAETERAEKPHAAREASAKEEAKENAKEKKADGKGWSSDKAMSDSKDTEEAAAFQELGNSGSIRSAELPALLVRLASGKRISDVVSGLKAMGADSLSAWSAPTNGDNAGKGVDYMFQVPASMRKDIGPYLERYGKVEGAGLLPASGSGPWRMRIRFLTNIP